MMRRPGPGTYSRKVLRRLESHGPQSAGELARALRPPRKRRQTFTNAAERRLWHARQRATMEKETGRAHTALAALVNLGWVAPSGRMLAEGVADDIERHGYAGAIWRCSVEARANGDYVGYLDESHRDSARAVDALRAVAERKTIPDGAPLAWLESQDLIEPAGLRCLVSDLPRVPVAPESVGAPTTRLHVCGRSTRRQEAAEAIDGRRFAVTRRLCDVCGVVVRETRIELGAVARAAR